MTVKKDDMQNLIQFAVVREDPEIESAILKKALAKNVLLVASGGCNAFNLKTLYPNTLFTLVDLNLAQINLVKEKINLLKDQPIDILKRFNIEDNSREGLNACGNFESLFRSFRLFINEFILKESLMQKLFEKNEDSHILVEKLITHKYWPVAFDLFFSDSILLAMFGESAIQHATPGSYPRYFQKVMAQGLKRQNYQDNYFLHHIFLGYYLPHALPIYLQQATPDFNFTFLHKSFLEIPNLGDFEVISLSNIFDWMDESQIFEYFQTLGNSMNPGSYLIYRQLNNKKDYSKFFSNAFSIDEHLGAELLLKDRSLFYEKINILQKKEA